MLPVGYIDRHDIFDSRMNKLTEVEQHLVSLLAISGKGIQTNDDRFLRSFADQYEIRSREADEFFRRPNAGKLEVAVRILNQKGWNIAKEGETYCFCGAERESFIRYLYQKGLYAGYYQTLLPSYSKLGGVAANLGMGYQSVNQQTQTLRHLIITLIPQKKVNLSAIRTVLPIDSDWEEITEQLLFCRNLPWVEFLESKLLSDLVALHLQKKMEELQTIPKFLVDYFHHLLEEGHLEGKAVLALFEYFWLTNHSLALSPRFPVSLLDAYAAISIGNASKAYEHFTGLPGRWAFLAPGNKPVTFPGLTGVLYTLCILGKNQAERFIRITDWVVRSERVGAIPCTLGQSWLLLAEMGFHLKNESALPGLVSPNYLQGNFPPGNYKNISSASYPQHWLELILTGLCRQWFDGSPPRQELYGLEETAIPRLGDYPRLAIQLASIHQDVPCQNPIPQWPELPLDISLVPFATLYRPPERWEKCLQGITQLVAKDANANPDELLKPIERLIWLVSYHLSVLNMTVTPMVQNWSRKRQQWTKGKKIELERLLEGYWSLDYLTDQDRLTIKAATDSSCRTAGQDGSIGGKSLLVLVGHPFLFLEDSPKVAVELVHEKPAVIIEQRKGGVLVKPDLRSTSIENSANTLLVENSKADTPARNDYSFLSRLQDLIVLRDAEDRFRIITFEPESRKLFELLSTAGTFFPDRAMPMLEPLLAPITKRVQLQSNLAKNIDGIEEVPCNDKLYLRLLPLEQEGISLEILVYPLGPSGGGFLPCSGQHRMVTEIMGKTIQTERNFDQEKKQLDELFTRCPSLQKAIVCDARYLLDSLQTSLEFIMELRAASCDFIEVQWPKGERYSVSSTASYSHCNLSFFSANQWLEITGNLQIDGLKIDFRKLLDLIEPESNDPFIKVGEKEYISLTNELRLRLGELKRLARTSGKKTAINKVAAITLDGFFDNIPSLQESLLWREIKERVASAIHYEPLFPELFHGQLRDYQREGFQWMARMAHWGVGVCLADDMGLGKTVQGLALLLARANKGPGLIVAPTSVVTNWEREATRFAPSLHLARIQAINSGSGTDRIKRVETIEGVKAGDILLTSYGLMHQEIETFEKMTFATIVLDESQAIKNPASRRAKAACRLKGDFRLAMSGTPIENRLTELWSLFRFLNPGLLPDHRPFEQQFTIPIAKEQSSTARSTLRRLVQPFILRRLKSEVLNELPPRTEIDLEVYLSAEERILYETIRQQGLDSLEKVKDPNHGTARIQILAILMKLRQLCCHSKLINPLSQLGSAKMDAFLKVADGLLENRHKTLVFSQFVGHLQLVARELDQRKVSYQYLDGSTTTVQRQKAIDAFQAGEGDFFLISLKAGGVGLNLTAADYVIHLDPWWNPAVEEQATDRTHRIGQTKPVTVYRLIAAGTIEDKIIRLHLDKRDLAQSILEGTEQTASLGGDELLAILREN